MSRVNTPFRISGRSFVGAPELESPLNDALRGLQERVALLEQSARLYVLGPRRIELPKDPETGEPIDFAAPLDFALPFSFTPSAVFGLALVPADVGGMDVVIQPFAITAEITKSFVRVRRCWSNTAGNETLNLYLGAFRAN